MNLSRFTDVVDQNATDRERVSPTQARAQLESAAAVRERLDEYGGAILGDEVGSGKTFTTFALVAEALIREPGKGAVIFVPGDSLKRKWARQLRDYLRVAVRDRAAREDLVRRVMTIDRSLRGDEPEHLGVKPTRRSIVVARHDVFSRQIGEADRAACLERWLELRGPRPRPRKRLFAACGVSTSILEDWEPTWAQDDVLTRRVLRPLDTIGEQWSEGKRKLKSDFRDRLQEVRREVGRGLVRDAALVVVDEAHNLRSSSSQVHRSFDYVLSAGFDAMLFLTATPFQLGPHEMSTVVNFFRHARRYRDHAETFDERVREMDSSMEQYVRAINAFGAAWDLLEGDDVAKASTLALDRKIEVDLTTETGQAARLFRNCLDARTRLEAGLRPFLVRTLREHNRHEHPGLDDAFGALTPESRIPLALVDRLITEVFAAKDQTFVASALTSACSSWEALFAASISTKTTAPGSRTRASLAKLRDHDLLGSHPKVEATVATCLDGIASGSKTLVFVERKETGKKIRELVEERLGEWHDLNARRRLQTSARLGWPSLRENYVHTLFVDAFGRPPPTPARCAALTQRPEFEALWRCVDPPGKSRDYKIEKRFLEHAVFTWAARELPSWRTTAANECVIACTENILQPDYILNGLDLRSNANDQRIAIPKTQQRSEARAPNKDFARAYAAYRSPWLGAVSYLRRLMPDARANIVDAAAKGIATSHLQREIAEIETAGAAARHFAAVEGLLLDPKTPWPMYFSTIAELASDEIAYQDDDVAADRLDQLVAALNSPVRVQFVDGGTPPDTKERAISGFNTPLYPQVLITTGLLGEGLDLHRSCRRVIHHDLPWNPAKLEQRTGRVDRLGSLSIRLEKAGRPSAECPIEIWLPYMSGTYDQAIYQRVMGRRQEFRCVLGSRPEWGDHGLDQEEGPTQIADALIDALHVDLEPRALTDARRFGG